MLPIQFGAHTSSSSQPNSRAASPSRPPSPKGSMASNADNDEFTMQKIAQDVPLEKAQKIIAEASISAILDSYVKEKPLLNEKGEKATPVNTALTLKKLLHYTDGIVPQAQGKEPILHRALHAKKPWLFNTVLNGSGNHHLQDKDSQGLTVMGKALRTAQFEIAEALLDKYPEEMAKQLTEDDLNVVAQCGKPELLDRLLEHKEVSKSEQQTLRQTATNQKQELEDLSLDQAPIGQHEFFIAQEVQFSRPPLTKTELITQYLPLGADINSKTMPAIHGVDTTPLMWTANSKRQVRALNALIQAGAKVDMQNERGGTALHIAAFAQNLRAIRALIKAEADVNIADNDANTALHLALLNNNRHEPYSEEQRTLIQELLKAGANPNTQNNEHRTPLLEAVVKEDASLVKILLAAGANVNAQIKDFNGIEVPILTWAKHKDPQVGKLLREAGAVE